MLVFLVLQPRSDTLEGYYPLVGAALLCSLGFSILADIYMETAINASELKPELRYCYVDDTYLATWYEMNFLSHINGLRESIKFTMEIEADNSIPTTKLLHQYISNYYINI